MSLDIKPAMVLSSVADPERRRMLTLMASAIEPPDRSLLPVNDVVAAGLAVLVAVVLLLLAV